LNRETTTASADPVEGVAKRAPAAPASEIEPFDWLPRLVLPQVRLEQRLAHWSESGALRRELDRLTQGTGTAIQLDRPEVLWRASGLRRPSLVVQLTAPRLATRLALGIEVPLAHTLVDRLLGFDRPFAESRLQLTPVEWGVWTFLVVRALDSAGSTAPPSQADRPDHPVILRLQDLSLDRVGPDPFDAAGLGSIVTIRWPVRLGNIASAARLWLPESVVRAWLASSPGPDTRHAQPAANGASPERAAGSEHPGARGELAGLWSAVAGFVALTQGLGRLRAGGVLPLADTRLTGSPRSPAGPVDLVLDLNDQDVRFRFPANPVADSGGRLLRIEAGMLREPRPRDPILISKTARTPMSQSSASPNPSPASAGPSALDVPVTLAVELGRVNLTLTQLADIKPGDVVELGRHSRAPVELTSNGRLVARGELVLIDTELGVRVTNVFL
jgi:type III secretion system YscQ/HrcQ family protein